MFWDASGCVFHCPPCCISLSLIEYHAGDPQSANLGDGNSWVNQTMELREDFGSASVGTCWESLAGRDHLCVYRQNGGMANSGALSLAYIYWFFRLL
ncbi:hypothetical protein B0H10DRAFT_1814564 [Mycena sp. CBHHK59/15]|nr:hypothetical protein B0H10DRAFT_1814564 [Mycena sp. CBHHK59/15]